MFEPTTCIIYKEKNVPFKVTTNGSDSGVLYGIIFEEYFHV